MSFLTLIVTAVGLAADAFAVAVGRGMRWRRFAWRPALAIALTFGAFQGVMPLLGWALGSSFAGTIVDIDHWVAFGLLAAIGGKMMWEAARDFREDRVLGDDASVTQDGEATAHAVVASGAAASGGAAVPVPQVRVAELLLLGIATSVDALAVGISLALLEVPIVAAAVLIAVVTAGLTLAGVAIGHHAGHRLRGYAELIGGGVLIAIGVKILLA